MYTSVWGTCDAVERHPDTTQRGPCRRTRIWTSDPSEGLGSLCAQSRSPLTTDHWKRHWLLARDQGPSSPAGTTAIPIGSRQASVPVVTTTASIRAGPNR